MQHRLDKKLAVYKLCNETFIKSINSTAPVAQGTLVDDGVDDDGLSQCSVAQGKQKNANGD